MPTDRSNYFKEWREKNKEKVTDYKQNFVLIKTQCPHCEAVMSRGNIKRHIKNIHLPSEEEEVK
jgi:hypothetical protein